MREVILHQTINVTPNAAKERVTALADLMGVCLDNSDCSQVEQLIALDIARSLVQLSHAPAMTPPS